MAAVPPYKVGSITVTSGSAVVTATGTAWNIGVVEGGELSFKGRSVPIKTIDSATQLTLIYPAPADMAGSGADYAIAIGRAGSADAATANARLAQLVAQLQGFSAFFQTLTDDPDQATLRNTIGAQAALGFTPIQQGGGAGQNDVKLNLGWASALGYLKAQVGSTDLGRIWTDYEAPKSLASTGFQRLPGGFVLQWGSLLTGGSDRAINYPAVFSSFAVPFGIAYSAGTPAYCHVDAPSNTGFTLRNRNTAGAAASVANFWAALGL
jgi:hypothetical protein